MHALIEELAAARAFRPRAPFAFVAGSAAMAVARAQYHEGAERTRLDQAARLLESAVIAQIETHANPHIVLACQEGQRAKFIRMPGGRLLDEYMAAGGNRRAHDFGMRVLGSRDDERVK